MTSPSPEYRQFQSSVPLRSDLDEILKNETLKKAISAVRSCATPENLPMLVPGQAFDITVAHEFYFMMGVNQALKLLKGLTEPFAVAKDMTEEELLHALPPELRSLTPHLG